MTKKEQKKKDWILFLEKLRATPPEKLSKYAKWLLENEKDKKEV